MPNSAASQILDNITTVMEFAPAAKKDPVQLTDMLCSAAEFRVAVRVLRGRDPYIHDGELDEVKVDSPADDQVALARKMLEEVRDLLQGYDPTESEQVIALDSMLEASKEMANNIRSLADA